MRISDISKHIDNDNQDALNCAVKKILKNLNNIGIINDVCSLYDNQSIICSELNIDPRLIRSIWRIDTIRNILYIHGYELEYHFSNEDYKIELINAMRQDLNSAIQDIKNSMIIKTTHLRNYIYLVVVFITLMIAFGMANVLFTNDVYVRFAKIMHEDNTILYLKETVGFYMQPVYKKITGIF